MVQTPARLLTPLLIAALVLASGLAVPADAQEGVWVPRGPEGGSVTAFAFHSADPEIVLAGTSGSGIFRSTDGGATWRELPGSPFSGEVHALAFDPDLPSRIYAALGDDGLGEDGGGGVYRTENGGVSWTRQLATPSVLDLAVDPVDTDVVWAVGKEGIFRSPDRGVTWQRPFDGPTAGLPAFSLLLDLDDPSRIYVGRTNEVLTGTDGGLTWSSHIFSINDPPPGPVRTLAASPAAPETIYAGLIGALFRSVDRGATWTFTGPGSSDVLDLVVDPDDPDVAHLIGRRFAASSQPRTGIFRTTDGGATWLPLTGGLAGEPLSLALDPRDADRVLAGTTEGPFQRPATAQPWTALDTGFFARPVRDLDLSPADPDLVLWVDTLGNGFRSVDGGVSWERISQTVASLTVHPSEASRVYGSSTLPEPFLVSRNGGQTLDTGSFPLSAADDRETVTFRALAVDPTDPDTLFVSDRFFRVFPFLVTERENVRRSRNGGATWQGIWNRQGLAALDLTVDPFDSDVLYAATDQGLRVSRSAGDLWEPLATFGTLTSLEHVAADSTRPGRLWLAGGSTLMRSDDGGLTAVPAGAGLPAGRLLDVTVDPLTDVVYVLVEDRGVFRSSDGGATWRDLTGSLAPDRLVGPLGVSATEPRTVWVGTATGPQALAGPPACTPGPTTLCLLGGRFRLQVGWEDFQGGTGPGRTRPVTDDTGTFWFFTPDNLELMVKVIDGRTVNGHFWVFYGSLSNVAFELTVTDTVTGRSRDFSNPRNRFASVGETRAFEGLDAGSTEPSMVLVPLDEQPGDANAGVGTADVGAAALASASELRPAPAGITERCGRTNLCLQDGRFRVQVLWSDFQGNRGQGKTVPLTRDTGAFWFFDPDNLELMVKVIDGRIVNGHYWVFLGALTNVEFEVLVTDTANGRSWIRKNPAGTFASIGDAKAFTGEPVSGGAP